MTGFFRRASDYGRFLRWFAGEMAPWRNRLVTISVCSLSGAVGQLLSFLLLYKFIGALQADRLLTVGAVRLGHAADGHVFIGVGVVAFLMMVFSAWLEFRGRVFASELGARYLISVEQRIYARVSLANSMDAPNLGVDDAGLAELLREARAAEGATRLLALGLANMLAVPFGICALLYLDPGLTALVLGLMVTGMSLLYRASLQLAAAKRDEMSLRTVANGERKRLNERVSAGYAPVQRDDPELLSYYHEGATRSVLLASRLQTTVMERSSLYVQILVSSCVTTVFLVGGERAVAAGSGWGHLIIFLLALRFTGGKVSGLVRTVIGLNRLYPGLRRYARHMQRLELLAARPPLPTPIPNERFKFSRGSKALMRGDLLGLLGPQKFNRPVVVQVAEFMQGLRVAPLRDGPKSWRSGLRRTFGLPLELDRRALLQQLEFLSLTDLQNVLPASLDEPVETLPDLAEATALAMGLNLLRMIHSGAEILVVDESVLRRATAVARSPILDYARACGLVIILKVGQPRIAEKFGIERYLLSDGDRISGEAGCGQWAELEDADTTHSPRLPADVPAGPTAG